MVRTFTAISFLCVVALPGCSSSGGMTQEMATGVAYSIEFTPSWTAMTHPIDYPPAGLLTGPHFSGLIGASHGDGYTLFAEGRLPTPGLERLSEEGKHSPLDEEIRAAISSGLAHELFESGPLKDLSQSASAMVHVDTTHPQVSVVAMIAPSPDWFAGVGNVDLREGNGWIKSKEVTVWAWDSGGDAGTTYLADDANLQPKQPTRLNDAAPFMKNGQRIAVGRLTFRRQ